MHKDTGIFNSTDNSFGALGKHAEHYIDLMYAQKYSQSAISRHRRWLSRLGKWMSEKQFSVSDLNETTGMQELGAGGKFDKLSISPASISKRFLGFLVDQGVSKRPMRQEPAGPRGQLRRDYEIYLREQKGLSEATIFSCWRWANRFLDFCFGDELGDLSRLTPNDIVRFLQHLIARRRSPLREARPPSHLKNFFRYLFQSGKTPVYLAAGVPNIRRSYAGRISRYLTADQIEQLLQAVHLSSSEKTRRRNYAMVLLQARLGLRTLEIIAIQVDDINWRCGEIIIRGKGGRHDRLPLPTDVGNALAEYLRLERPRTTSRSLFITAKAPYQPFNHGQIILKILRKAFAVSGLKQPAPYLGSHVLRHSLASHLAQQGASLGEIGDLLRHRSRASTLIYAKLDIEALRSIAQYWPVTGDAL